MFTLIEKYVCHLYGQPDAHSINNVRYRMFKLGKCTEESLPPNSDSLHQHILILVNYESYIRKHSTIAILAAASPVGFGWYLKEDNLEIKWGTQEPAPDSILEYVYVFWKCKKGCHTKRCSCQKSNLKCTKLCQCTNCENSESSEMEGDKTALDFDDGAFEDGDARDCSDDELF